MELDMGLLFGTGKIFNITASSAIVKLLGYWNTRAFVFNVSAGSLEVCGRYYPVNSTVIPFVITGTGILNVSGTVENDSLNPLISLALGNTLITNTGTFIYPSTTHVLTSSEVQNSTFSVDAQVDITVDGVPYSSNLGTAAAIPNATDLGSAFRIVGADPGTDYVVNVLPANVTRTIIVSTGTYGLNNRSTSYFYYSRCKYTIITFIDINK